MSKVKCLSCDDIIESQHRHDFVRCKCGKIAVDGGDDYLRLVGELENMVILQEDVLDGSDSL